MTPNVYSAPWFGHFMPLQEEERTRRDVAFPARQLPRRRCVVDLCRGYGRHAPGLARRGYRVTGVDRDVAALAEVARVSRWWRGADGSVGGGQTIGTGRTDAIRPYPGGSARRRKTARSAHLATRPSVD